MKNNEKSSLILASKSLRRKALLERAGVDISVKPSGIIESNFQPTTPAAYVKTLAQAKAQEIARRYPQNWVLGADTNVVINGSMLGKPKGTDQARQMLLKLSGVKHQVFTGFTLCHQEKMRQYVDTVVTDVYFKTLRKREIDRYIATGDPFDKAGAYGIQDRGAHLVKKIDGSYTNVVGLPLCEVMELLNIEGVVR